MYLNVFLSLAGPDICGPSNKKVHVIFSYKGKNHLIKKEIRPKDDVYTHLYTLVVKPDQTYEVLIDNEKVESGSFEEDWDFLPPKKIKDPEAKKPEDWDDRAKIDDPEDSKPSDWDQAEHIPDPEAKAKAQKELLELQQQGRLAELNADNIEAQEITKRQESDMASDSWMSKNIRPMTLIAILGGYFTFAMMSAFGYEANQNYVTLLGNWGMLVMSFYFGGRTLEKIMDMKK